MKKKITIFILFSSIILAMGCSSNDSLAGVEPVQVSDAVEEIKEPIEELKENTVEETVEESAEEHEEEVSEETKEELIDDSADEINNDPEEEQNELTEVNEEQTEQIEETSDEEPQVVQEEKKEDKVEEKNVIEEIEPEYYWILNTNTKKVHKPTCNSVKQMKEKNKKESNLSPEELKEKGYEPCKNCNPFR